MIKILNEKARFRTNIGDVVSLYKEPFKSSGSKKLVDDNHMFVVVNKKPVVVCLISSENKKVNKNFPWNVALLDWKEDGLYKPCHVKVDNSGIISNENVLKFHGHLTDRDLERVMIAYLRAPQDQVLENFENI